MLQLAPLQDVQITARGSGADIERIVAVLNRHNDRVWKATIISTFVVSLAALLNTWRLMKQLKRDENLIRRSTAR